ncbi:MAG: MOSC domain-containing protein [Acidimicrobiales bacterium]
MQVNVGRPTTVEWHGRAVTSSIAKKPVSGPVLVDGVNLSGDEQSDQRVHGGRYKAVYAYSAEDYRWWSDELGETVPWARFGENLTVEGIDLQHQVIGTPWRVGSATLAVSTARFPCFKLGMAMGDAAFVARFDAARRNGTYLEISTGGTVTAGDTIEVGRPPGHGVTIDMMVRANAGEREMIERLLDVEELDPEWKDWARRMLARKGETT